MIFDWGGVLIDDPSGGLVRYCAKQLDVDEALCGRVFERHLPEFQKDKILEAVFWQRVCHDFSIQVPDQPSLWSEAFGNVCQPRQVMFDLAQSLGEHYKVAALSNTEVPAIEHFLAHRSELFEVKVFSCDEGIIKPAGELFERCVQRLGVGPQEALLIDDRAENVAGARAIGLQAILYEGYRELIDQLERLGVDHGQ